MWLFPVCVCVMEDSRPSARPAASQISSSLAPSPWRPLSSCRLEASRGHRSPLCLLSFRPAAYPSPPQGHHSRPPIWTPGNRLTDSLRLRGTTAASLRAEGCSILQCPRPVFPLDAATVGLLGETMKSSVRLSFPSRPLSPLCRFTCSLTLSIWLSGQKSMQTPLGCNRTIDLDSSPGLQVDAQRPASLELRNTAMMMMMMPLD